ncbi:MlaD family protein [Nocardia sp. NPDC058058]|uniref:MlaD family protein n=1 Tax=Nocardia sp. NPDC058058 TaxID=3346317 RepID=UPI0036D81C6F
MLRSFIASRAFVSIMAGVLAVIVAAVGAVYFLEPNKKMIAYCAIMPDGIGLYRGNDVKMRGMKVGSVTDLRPEGTGVRVDFEVEAAHPLRGEASATTVSDSIVADRTLAVFGTKGADWKNADCITKTVTPKSLTQTFSAMSKVADELQGGDDPAQADRIKQAITLFDRATAGSGPKINDIITQLSAALRSPDAAVSHIGSLIDKLNELIASVANNWGDLRQMLDGFAPILQTVNDVWDQVTELVNSIVTILPWLNDVTTKYGGPILQLLDSSVPLVHLLGANVGGLQQLVSMVPSIAGMFRTATDPQTGAIGVSWAAPRVALPAPQAEQVCAALNAVAPGRCGGTADGMTSVDLVPLILGSVGVR